MLLLILLLLLCPSVVYAQLAPVDSNASLLKGLVGHWIAQPPTMGGLTWYPRVGQDKGTLVNMATVPASGWQPTVRPGGVGEMRFDGTDDQVNTGTIALVANLPAFTVCLWFRSTANGTHQLYTEGVGSWPDMMLVLDWGGDPGTTIAFNNYDASGGLEAYASALPALTNSGAWHHVCGVQRSKSNGEVWFNGWLAATSSGAVGTVAPTQRTFGGTPQGTNRLAGAMDDIRVYTRALSAAEVAQLYAQSSRTMLQQVVRGNAFFTSSVFRGSLMPFFSLP
jgi:hypothetical protein